MRGKNGFKKGESSKERIKTSCGTGWSHILFLVDNIIQIGLSPRKNPSSYLIVERSDQVGKRRSSDKKKKSENQCFDKLTQTGDTVLKVRD